MQVLKFKQLKIKIYLLLAFAFCFQTAYAQLNGISGSKISAFSYDPLPANTIELEPTYSFSRANSYFDNEGKSFKTDSISINSSLCWRATYGIADLMELAIMAPSDLSTTNLAFKAYLLNIGKLHLTTMAGVNLALGNRVSSQANPNIDELSTFGLGMIASLVIDDKNSIDLNYQVQDYFKSIENLTTSSTFINMDYGTRVANDNILLILGMGYQKQNFEAFSQNKFSLYPGISIEYGENYLIVINTQHDLFGKNMEKAFGFGLSVTTILR